MGDNGRRPAYLVEAVVFGTIALVAAVVYFGFIRGPSRPNVILISIDTLRPDHLSCYGYRQPTSPNIDHLAAEGARFEYVHSSTTWTLPAHMSLLTGLPNELHGVVWDLVALDKDRVMLAQRFKQAGYVTGGFYGGPYLHPFFGFGRGFDVYENCGKATFYDLDQSSLDPALRQKLLQQKEIESHQIRTADTTQNMVEKFLNDHGEQPFFLFIHHWDTHYDFNAPREFVELFAPGYRGKLSMRNFIFNDEINENMDDLDMRYLLANYDAEIRWVDHQIGRLLQKLTDLGIGDNTYIVVTGDHGEEFFEHHNKGHRTNLYEETLRIPLIVFGPGIRHGLVVGEHARIFDIAPTLLNLAGLPPAGDIYGSSLVPLLDGDATAELADLPLMGELTLVPKVLQEDGKAKSADYFYKHVAVGRGRLKLIEEQKKEYDPADRINFRGQTIESLQPQLFDHSKDPADRTNLADREPDLLERLRALKKEIVDILGTRLGKLQDLPEDIARRLIQNGYLQAVDGK